MVHHCTPVVLPSYIILLCITKAGTQEKICGCSSPLTVEFFLPSFDYNAYTCIIPLVMM